MAPTMKQVAELSKVSLKTVSNVINHHPHVRENTRQRVLRAIADLGFVPDSTARKLARKRGEGSNRISQQTMLRIGCVLRPEIKKYEDPFFLRVFKGIEQEARAAGNELVFIESWQELHENPLRANRLLNPDEVDGIITFIGRDKKELFERLEKTAPMISVGKLDGYDNVEADLMGGAQMAVEYLAGLGHEKIAFIGPQQAHAGGLSERFSGFLLGLSACNLENFPQWQVGEGFGIEHGARAAQELLACKNLPTAVFCASDLTAIGAVRTLRKAGVRIPEDMSLVGFDGIPEATMIDPPLTTIYVDQEELGRTAVRCLMERIHNPKMPPSLRRLPVRLEIRESTKAVTD